jgi:glucose/arabinose dehydrogenase
MRSRTLRRRLFWTGVACALLALAALDVLFGAADRFHQSATKGRSAMRRAALAAIAMVVVGATAGMAIASVREQGPPPPRAASGTTVAVVGHGVPTPTSFAFANGHVFVSAFGSEDGKASGGVYVLRGGNAVRIPGLPSATGLAWKNGTLYVAAWKPPTSSQLLAYSGWNGTTFTNKRVVWTGPERFTGLNGIAIGWDGRIYAGVSLTDAGDHSRSYRPYAQSVISMRRDGTDARTVARGLRQPWQLVFAKGVSSPFVTVLGQENLGRKQPPDYVIMARDGENYGFPACNWSKPARCAEYAKPFAFFPAHSSPTGIAAGGSRLYVALLTGSSHGPEIVTLPATGGKPRPYLSGFAAPVVAVGFSGGFVYAGDLTGSIYRASS